MTTKYSVTYRLPTEAEWEYAAKVSDGRKYPWGNAEPDYTYANYDYYVDKTTAVDRYEKGKYWCGAYDMAGNVWEWCTDWYSSSYYSSSPTSNPTGPSSGLFRVLRGGSWYDFATALRCAVRGVNYPSTRYNRIGFRVLRSP